MRVLKTYFVSSWVLLHDLKAKVVDINIPAAQKHKYNTTLETYSFPVECMVQYSNGTVLHHENLNDILFPDKKDELEEAFQNDGLSSVKFGNLHNYRYAQFLTRGLNKAGIAHNTQVNV